MEALAAIVLGVLEGQWWQGGASRRRNVNNASGLGDRGDLRHGGEELKVEIVSLDVAELVRVL
jgi:hypothetical protein